MFLDLSTTRPSGFNGIERLSNAEILSWIALSGDYIRREEIQIIKAVDAAYCAAMDQESADQAVAAEGVG